jgi:hypothetical protein
VDFGYLGGVIFHKPSLISWDCASSNPQISSLSIHGKTKTKTKTKMKYRIMAEISESKTDLFVLGPTLKIWKRGLVRAVSFWPKIDSLEKQNKMH